jgi:hypothetical protein
MLASIFYTLSFKLSLPSAFVRSQWINPSCLKHPSLAVPTLRLRSVAQLPLYMRDLLESRVHSPVHVTKLRKQLHFAPLSSFYTLWLARCNYLHSNHLLFRDRLRLSSNPGPLIR